MTDDERANRFAATVMEVYGFVPLSVRHEAAMAAMAVAERYFATPLPTTQSGCPCGCHDVVQPGLVPCPTCEHFSR